MGLVYDASKNTIAWVQWSWIEALAWSDILACGLVIATL